jgi:pyruvyl transferase EpsO
MFYSDPKLLSSVERYAAHGKVTIAARDALSFHVLEKFFGSHCEIVMAPDMAYMLGPQRRNGTPKFDVLWLSRTDSEGVHGGNIAKAVNLPDLAQVTANLGQFADGIETVALADVSGSKLIVSDWYRCQFTSQTGVAAYQKFSFDQQAKFWVDRAITLLSAGTVVITDRLHAHVLCTLAGIPHILLNNVYGKNISFYETWCRPLDICHLASSPEHAWGIAQDFLKRNAAQRSQSEARPVA